MANSSALARIAATAAGILERVGRAPRTLLLVLLAAGLQPATAFGVDGDGETTFAVPLQANHGLSAKLEADDDEIELKMSKNGQQSRLLRTGRGERGGDRGDSIRFGAIGARKEDERPYTYFFAVSQEVREGVGISRLTLAGTRSAGFRFDNRRGTALVNPPAPFAGLGPLPAPARCQ